MQVLYKCCHALKGNFVLKSFHTLKNTIFNGFKHECINFKIHLEMFKAEFCQKNNNRIVSFPCCPATCKADLSDAKI